MSTPPASSITGWHGFHPDDAGYIELRKLFDFLREVNQIGPKIAGREGDSTSEGSLQSENNGQVEVCLIDAENLLNDPESICKAYCKSVGLQFECSMLSWKTPEDRRRAEVTFKKSLPEHDVAINSTSITPQVHVSIVSCFP